MMNAEIQRRPLPGAVPPSLMVAGTLVLGLLAYGLSAGNRSRIDLAGDRLIVAQCWSAIDRVGHEHPRREALLEGCRRMEQGFQRIHGSLP